VAAKNCSNIVMRGAGTMGGNGGASQGSPDPSLIDRMEQRSSEKPLGGPAAQGFPLASGSFLGRRQRGSKLPRHISPQAQACDAEPTKLQGSNERGSDSTLRTGALRSFIESR